MQKRQTITAVIPAKNEQDNIARCLESVKWCDQILVMWMGNDKTGEIAEKMGAKVMEMNKKENDDFIAVQKNINWAIDNCKTDWILRIDVDEVVSEELKEEIENILNAHNPELTTQNVVAYGIPRKQYFWGGFLRGGDWAYDRLIRLFKPQYARYEPLVSIHEQFKVKGRIDYLKHHLLHYSHPTLDVAIKKFDKYTSLQIADINDSYLQALMKVIFLPPYIFLRWMIWHQGYKDGLRGIVAGAFRAWYEFILYKKYIKKIRQNQ